MSRILILTLLLSFLFINANSQTLQTIDSLEKAKQNCLDAGMAMTSCSSLFYHQMDSILNVVYKKVYFKNNTSQKIELKKSQLQWLKERDSYFKQTIKENKKEAEKDETLKHFSTMLNLQEMAAFVQERVVYLIKLL